MSEYIEVIDDIYYLTTFAKKIKVFIQKIEEGETDYCEELAMKIRICLIPKGRNPKPPFIANVMNRYGIDLLVNEPEPMNKITLLKASFAYSSNSELWFSEIPSNKLSPILEVFNSQNYNIKFGEELFTYKEIIETLADKFGGAHIDEKVEKRKLLVFSNSIIIYGLNINNAVTLATGKSLLIAIEKILNFISTKSVDNFLVKKKG